MEISPPAAQTMVAEVNMFGIATLDVANQQYVLAAIAVCTLFSSFFGAFFTILGIRNRRHQAEARERAKKKDYKFCPICAHKLGLKDFSGKEKNHCFYCGWTHWNGPAMVSILVVFSKDGKKVLLIKRLIPPGKDKHAHAGGFLETGEGLIGGAEREGVEETGLKFKVLEFLMEFPIPANNENLVFWLAEEVGGEIRGSEETAEVAYYDLDKLPEIAFPSHKQAIELAIQRRNAAKG
jgi:ADP-ribose pyrophosphatase YjhB (NUDIX family)